jgi:hypothetical protein
MCFPLKWIRPHRRSLREAMATPWWGTQSQFESAPSGRSCRERWLHGAVDLEGGAQGKSKFALASEG